MNQYFVAIGAASGFLSVCSGAFAAHALKQQLTPNALAIWQTGAQYQMYHALALLLSGVLYQHKTSKSLKLSGIAFILGSFLFSGTLYALALGAHSSIGMITPIGGLSFLVGWAALMSHALQR